MTLKRDRPLPKPRTMDTITPKEIVEKFTDALKTFKPRDGQTSETYITRIWEVASPLLLQVPYNKTGGTHNLIGLIWPVAAYKTRYGAEFE